MSRTKNYIVLTFASASLAFFYIVSFGHPMGMSSTMQQPSEGRSITDHCRSVCSPPLLEKHRAPTGERREILPEPFSFAQPQSGLYSSLLYIVALNALALAYLRRKPPDLITEYGRRRN